MVDLAKLLESSDSESIIDKTQTEMNLIQNEVFSDYDSVGMVSPSKQSSQELLETNKRDASDIDSSLSDTDDARDIPPKKLIIIDSCSEKYGSRQAQTESLIRRPFTKPVLTNLQFKGKINKAFKPPVVIDPSKTFSGSCSSQSKARPSMLGMLRKPTIAQRALHDYEAEGTIILFSPPERTTEQELAQLKTASLRNQQLKQVHVVVDPILGKRLRPHQIEGVQFLYDCLTGAKDPSSHGCIIADEMGLGKTLQCIAVLWTMLKQSPTPGKPYIDKAIIVCPSSLVSNWSNELVKWLTAHRISPLACDGKSSRAQVTQALKRFMAASGRRIANPVLIISYETLRQYVDVIGTGEIGLMLADEGHRLKNKDSNTYKALHSLNVKRRVIMSGTPIQNDLKEYFALLNFANPNLLGSEKEFHRDFDIPILRGQDRGASDKEKELAERQLNKLYEVANKFIIRRTAELLTKYLPIKYEHIVFCSLSSKQKQFYKSFSKSKLVKQLLSGACSQPLKAVTMLRKLCNHESLLDSKELNLIRGDAGSLHASSPEFEDGGKLFLLQKMLVILKNKTTDKVVLISNFVQTLDLLENLCKRLKLECLRLDGSMTIPKRQRIVDNFNQPNSSARVFLLSSKAGGCGINLIGGNRLVLFDPDWNPASDLQALARVWREGQKKTCYIYRFVNTGTIEEKILMRQAHKQSLSSVVVDEEQEVERHFSLGDLRRLFQLSEDTLSEMHDVFRCKRCVKNRQLLPPEEKAVNTGAQAQDTSTWNHFSNYELHKVHDSVLKEAGKGLVTYVFQNKSHDAQIR